MREQRRVVTSERFGSGMTFEQYVRYVGTPQNLSREAGWWLGPARVDFGDHLRQRYEQARLTDAQAAAARWLAARRDGPAKVLVIAEEWSSDCRRDVPMLARLAATSGMELRVFCRDGQTVGRGPRAIAGESPHADLVNEFLNVKDGRTWQSIPVAAFFTADLGYIYHYVEYPAIYHKDRLAEALRAVAATEAPDRAFERFIERWRALQDSPFFAIWAHAAVDEILSALHERLTVR